jgi:hypothetical protein
MFDSGTTSRGIHQVYAVPFIAVATTDAGQVRTGPLRPHWKGGRRPIHRPASRAVALGLGSGTDAPSASGSCSSPRERRCRDPFQLQRLYGSTPSAGSVTSRCAISGTISTRPPMLITTAISTPSGRCSFQRFHVSWCHSSKDQPAPRPGSVSAFSRDHGLPDVVGHEEHADRNRAAEQAHVRRTGTSPSGLDEGVGQRAVLVVGAPHQALHDAGDTHIATM